MLEAQLGSRWSHQVPHFLPNIRGYTHKQTLITRKAWFLQKWLSPPLTPPPPFITIGFQAMGPHNELVSTNKAGVVPAELQAGRCPITQEISCTPYSIPKRASLSQNPSHPSPDLRAPLASWRQRKGVWTQTRGLTQPLQSQAGHPWTRSYNSQGLSFLLCET